MAGQNEMYWKIQKVKRKWKEGGVRGVWDAYKERGEIEFSLNAQYSRRSQLITDIGREAVLLSLIKFG
jgi:hypothetical protein